MTAVDLATAIAAIHNSEGAAFDTTAGVKISRVAQFRSFQLKQSQVGSRILGALAVERGQSWQLDIIENRAGGLEPAVAGLAHCGDCMIK